MSITALNTTTTLAPSKKAAREAGTLLAFTEHNKNASVTVSIEGKGSSEISAELLTVLQDALAIISLGGQAKVQAVPHDLTTTVAAKRIGISRPTLMKLVRKGEIPAHKVGAHTRIKTQDADAYRARLLKEKTQKQKQAFENLLELEAELEN